MDAGARKDHHMKVGDNCRVRLNYTIRLQEGQIVDKNPGDQPLEFNTGKSEVIPVLENGVMGMEPGEKKTFHTGPEEAFGPRDPEATRIVSRDELVNRGDDLEEGLIFKIKDENEKSFVITVLSLDEEEVVFDLNHPLAGSPLAIEVEIIGVEAAD
jgi:FKBP-type peptidyl-prolyl cis-trans isomerase 2